MNEIERWKSNHSVICLKAKPADQDGDKTDHELIGKWIAWFEGQHESAEGYTSADSEKLALIKFARMHQLPSPAKLLL